MICLPKVGKPSVLSHNMITWENGVRYMKIVVDNGTIRFMYYNGFVLHDVVGTIYNLIDSYLRVISKEMDPRDYIEEITLMEKLGDQSIRW